MHRSVTWVLIVVGSALGEGQKGATVVPTGGGLKLSCLSDARALLTGGSATQKAAAAFDAACAKAKAGADCKAAASGPYATLDAACSKGSGRMCAYTVQTTTFSKARLAQLRKKLLQRAPQLCVDAQGKNLTTPACDSRLDARVNAQWQSASARYFCAPKSCSSGTSLAAIRTTFLAGAKQCPAKQQCRFSLTCAGVASPPSPAGGGGSFLNLFNSSGIGTQLQVCLVFLPAPAAVLLLLLAARNSVSLRFPFLSQTLQKLYGFRGKLWRAEIVRPPPARQAGCRCSLVLTICLPPQDSMSDICRQAIVMMEWGDEDFFTAWSQYSTANPQLLPQLMASKGAPEVMFNKDSETFREQCAKVKGANFCSISVILGGAKRTLQGFGCMPYDCDEFDVDSVCETARRLQGEGPDSCRVEMSCNMRVRHLLVTICITLILGMTVAAAFLWRRKREQEQLREIQGNEFQGNFEAPPQLLTPIGESRGTTPSLATPSPAAAAREPFPQMPAGASPAAAEFAPAPLDLQPSSSFQTVSLGGGEELAGAVVDDV